MNRRALWIHIPVALLALTTGLINLSCSRGQDPSAWRWGLLVPLSGDRAAYGVAIRDGAQLAVDEINASSKEGDPKIQLIVEDTRSTTRDCVSAFEKLSSSDGARVILGPMSSSELLAIAPLAEARGILLFSPSASSPAISTAGDYVFRNVPSDVFEAGAMAEVAYATLHHRKIGLLYVNLDYGIGVSRAFGGAFKALGGKIVLEQAYADGTRDFRTFLLQQRESGADALYLVGYKEMGIAVSQAREVGLPQSILSTAIFEDPEILRAAGSAAEGLIFTSITFDPASADPRAASFTRNFRARYLYEPDGYAASAYDAASILAFAANRAGGSEPKALREALYSVQAFPGLLGNVAFDSNGDVVLPIRLKWVHEGKFSFFPPSTNDAPNAATR